MSELTPIDPTPDDAADELRADAAGSAAIPPVYGREGQPTGGDAHLTTPDPQGGVESNGIVLASDPTDDGVDRSTAGTAGRTLEWRNSTQPHPDGRGSLDAFGDPGAAADWTRGVDWVDGAVLRLLDANANRAREALRVLEDYARFVLDSGGLSGSLKAVRHGLAGALSAVLPEAILHRDTPGDVGTANKTNSEFDRADLGDVVTAASKRLGEALRSIEEYLKTIDPAAAAQVESLRYQTYELERQLALTIRPAVDLFADVELYVLITESVCGGRPWLDVAGDALEGGADCIQLREKDLEPGELLRRAKDLVALCGLFGVPCVINDRPDIAVLAGADGVHVGQGDLPAAEARKIVGPRRLVGVSTHELAHARQAVLDGADYVGVGPFFRSTTKPRDFTAGPEYARAVAGASLGIPAVAIAGITVDNVDQVLATGVRAVAVSSAVTAAADVRVAARALKARLRSGKGRQSGRESSKSSVGRTFLSAGTRARASSPGPTRWQLEVARRRLPHWRLSGSTYFLTFRLARGELPAAERAVVLNHVRAGDGQWYKLVAAVVMPDHVHLLLRPNDGVDLSRILKGIKGVSARLVNAARNTTGQVWQDESWDRIMRDQDELDEKIGYMLANPVRKGLATDGWAWDGWHYNGQR
jgi:thiamine-phosphate pyrophosphorylase